jgi:hypothetical protein
MSGKTSARVVLSLAAASLMTSTWTSCSCSSEGLHGSECQISHEEAEPLEGRHFLLRAGGPDVRTPRAAVSGDVLAVAFQHDEWTSEGLAGKALRVATSRIDPSGEPGDVVITDIKDTGLRDLSPSIVPTPDGFFLTWVEWDGSGEPDGHHRVKLDTEARIIDGPFTEDMGPCGPVKAAWSGDTLGLACRERGDWDETGALRIAVAGATGTLVTTATTGACYGPGTPPGIIWDGEAFDVFHVCHVERGIDAWRWDLVMTRFDTSGTIIASDIVIHTGGMQDSAPGALWSGSEIVLAWYTEYPDRGVQFARLDRSGDFLTEPVTIESAGGHVDIAPLGGGYLILASGCEYGDEDSSSWLLLCPVDADGTPLDSCFNSGWYGCDDNTWPWGVSLAPHLGGVHVLFDEIFELGSRPRSSIFHSYLGPTGGEISEPRPFMSPVGFLSSLSLACETGTCLVLGAQDASSVFMLEWEHRDLSWVALDTDTGDMTETPIPLLPGVRTLASGDTGEGAGVVWWSEIWPWPPEPSELWFYSVMTDGSIGWSANLMHIPIWNVHSIRAYAEAGGFRLFYMQHDDEESWCHAFLHDGIASYSSYVQDRPDHGFVGRDGVYYGYSTDAESRFTVHRWIRDEDDGFEPFAEGSGYISDLHPNSTMIAGSSRHPPDTWSNLLIKRWDVSGLGYDDCVLELPFDSYSYSTTWAEMDGELAVVLHLRYHPGYPVLLWKIGLTGEGSLYSLNLPAGVQNIHGVVLDTASSEVMIGWNDVTTADSYLSIWSL